MVNIDKTVKISYHDSPWNNLCKSEILLKNLLSNTTFETLKLYTL